MVPELTRFNLSSTRVHCRWRDARFPDLQQSFSRICRTAADSWRRSRCPACSDRDLTDHRRADLSAAVLSPPPRFQALNRALQAARGGPRRIYTMEGSDRLEISYQNNMAIGGATAAFQVHLRVPIRDFVRAWNAALLAAPLVLAVSPNSPILLGHRLWQETRIPLDGPYTDNEPTSSRTCFVPPPRALFGLGWLQRSPIDFFRRRPGAFCPAAAGDCGHRAPHSSQTRAWRHRYTSCVCTTARFGAGIARSIPIKEPATCA